MVVATMEARQRPGLLVAGLQRLELSSTEEFASCRKPNLEKHRVLDELERLERLDNVDKDRKIAEHDHTKNGNDANEADEYVEVFTYDPGECLLPAAGGGLLDDVDVKGRVGHLGQGLEVGVLGVAGARSENTLKKLYSLVIV